MRTNTHVFFSAMANPVRLRCLLLMQLEGELCVCELTHALGLSQPMISRHLALLRDAQLVQARREGQWMYYQLHPGLDDWAKQVLAVSAKANRDQAPFIDDHEALRSLPGRPASVCCA